MCMYLCLIYHRTHVAITIISKYLSTHQHWPVTKFSLARGTMTNITAMDDGGLLKKMMLNVLYLKDCFYSKIKCLLILGVSSTVHCPMKLS